MNCPVCNRNNAVTLSICPSCGTMINDSVREELKDKISPIYKTSPVEKKEFFNVPTKIEPQIVKAKINAPVIAPTQKSFVEKTVTSEIAVKTTMPTLAEFHSKNSALPEWRVQLQNAVKKRQSVEMMQSNEGAVVMTSGANALKIQPQYAPEVQSLPVLDTISHANPTLNSALQRIAQSRQQFLIANEPEIAPIVAETVAPTKNYPFRLATKAGEIIPETKSSTVNYTVKPRTDVSFKTEVKEFDTNKLPLLTEEVAEAFDIHRTVSDEEIKEPRKIELKLVGAEEIVEDSEIDTEEIEDIAPFSMRFNAGLFDLIIGSFVTLILLAPFMLKGGWFSFVGFLGFLAVCAGVMFVYMTVGIGFYGRTIGMRIFALEVVDIEGENYPTIHQAAVSSSLYLLSMVFGGAGFLTIPFNEEKRAVHDLASGTIVVKQL